MPETDPFGHGKFVRVPRIPLLQFPGGRFLCGGDVLSKELHLLGHAAFDDLVVLVEAQRQCLAVKHLGLHLLFHHAAELLRGGVAPPLGLEQHGQLLEVAHRQLDLQRRGRCAAGRLQVLVSDEQHGAHEQKMQQRFTQ